MIDAVHSRGERPLGLESGKHGQVAFGRADDHSFEECAPIGGIRHTVQRDHVHQDCTGMRRIGRDHERRRVRDETDLADGTHTFVRREMVEHGERLHRERQTDAVLEPGLEIGDPAALATDDAIVVAVKEPHQAQAG